MPVPVILTNRLLQRYPLSEHLPYRAYESETGLYLMEDGRCGTVFACNPLLGLGEQSLAKLANLFEMDLPIGTTVQVAMHASPLIEPQIQQYANLRKTAAPALERLATRTANFYRANRRCLIPSSGLPARDLTVYVSITMPLAGQHIRGISKEYITEKLAGIEQLLTSCGLAPQPLKPAALLELLHLLLNPSHPPEQTHMTYDPYRFLSDQAIRYDTVTRLTPRYIELDGMYVKSLSVQQYPDQWHGSRNRDFIGSLHRSMDQITTPFWMTLNTLRIDPDSTVSTIRKKHLLITNQSMGGLLNVVPQLKRKKENFDAMVGAMADGRQPIGLYWHVLLYCESQEKAERQSQAVQALYRSLDWLLQEDQYIGLPMFCFSMPMALPNDTQLLRDKLRRMKTMHTGIAPHLCPVVGDWKGLGDPVLLLTGRSGQLINMDFFANPSGNYNICVAAKSGSGKSFFANELIRSYLGIGGRVWMIDAGRSYVKLCEQVGGEYIEFGKRHHEYCLNPIASVVERDTDEMAMLKAIFAQMASPSRCLTDLEMSWIEQALNRVLNEQGCEGTPTDVARILLDAGDERQRDLGQMLYPYTAKGNYGRLFNRAALTPEQDRDINLSFANPFVVLELDGLETMPEVRSVILLQLLFTIQGAMYEGARAQPKICAMDEAWDLLSQGGNTAAFFEKSVRRVRKYGGAILTITQGINDYYDKMALVGQALLENSDFIVLLQQKPESVESIKERRRLVFSEYEFSLLNSLHKIDKQYSELYLYTPVGRTVARLVTDRYTQLYYSTTATELAAISAWQAKGLSVEEAIQRILEEEGAGPRAETAA
jgi:conjugal transfer ATP-binding protein TraC